MHICLGHLYIYVSCISLYICVVYLHKYILCMSINIFVVCLDTYISCISLYIYILYIFINIYLVDLSYMPKYCISSYLSSCFKFIQVNAYRVAVRSPIPVCLLSVLSSFFSSGTSYHWDKLWNRPCENCDSVIYGMFVFLRFWCIDMM